MISGFATEHGTQAFLKRFGDGKSGGHFTNAEALWLSTIGLGTYLGDLDDQTDAAAGAAARACISTGVNVFDAAINYRAQRSERVLGDLFRTLGTDHEVKREEIFVSTKGGFIPFDQTQPEDPRAYFIDEFVTPKVLTPEDVIQGCHAMTPKYLIHQINQSQKNLNLETIDLYYIHNPEIQLEEIWEKDFYERLVKAFQALEEAVKQGKIKMYGTATWNGYRMGQNEKGFLALDKILNAAEQAGGSRHHFKAIQLPYNLAMPEAFAKQNQNWRGDRISTIEYAKRAGLLTFSSASLLQGKLARKLPDQVKDFFKGCASDATCALQFVRSTPGVTGALCGMKDQKHIKENLALFEIPTLSDEEFLNLFSKQE